MAVAGAAIGAVLALFLMAVFVIVLVTARKAPPAAFSDKVIDLPPTHKPPPPYSERAPTLPPGVHASQVPWLCQVKRNPFVPGNLPRNLFNVCSQGGGAEKRTVPAVALPTRRSPAPKSRLEWVCHQSGSERVFINHREHYV
ncbi:uncharacterized protein LOC144212633 [Stigmatopora nigra]